MVIVGRVKAVGSYRFHGLDFFPFPVREFDPHGPVVDLYFEITIAR